MQNPFQLTRAADLNDDQIQKLWVDPNGFFEKRLHSESALPMLILGGKGSGKTHLMRYFSFSIQRRVLGGSASDVAKRLGFIGIYNRCSGLNASRFKGKRHNEDQWIQLFGYYVDLWFGQLILDAVLPIINEADNPESELRACLELTELFSSSIEPRPTNFREFLYTLQSLQKELDHAINNAAFGRQLEPVIRASRGSLLYGIPKILAENYTQLQGLLFCLLIDEYEHFSEPFQIYVNTLLREREGPITFKIGTRLYGMKTFNTLSNEELKEGSEYEVLNLDKTLREDPVAYASFTRNLCMSRLKHQLVVQTEENPINTIDQIFEPPVDFNTKVKNALTRRNQASPWIVSLESHLKSGGRLLSNLGVSSTNAITEILANVTFKPDLLIEKTSVFLLYRAWSGQEDLVEASKGILESALAYQSGQRESNPHHKVLDKFREDLKAQMLRSLELPIEYVGFETWVRMSSGIARNLITTLKHIFDWSVFDGENFCQIGGVSLKSQMRGVEDASRWFVEDARVLGLDHGTVRAGVTRVASLLRALRFSEKPPECSLSTFSVELDSIPPLARRAIQSAEHWSLLINTGFRPDRNTNSRLPLYRVNGMIAPQFDLPLATRGVIHLACEEAMIIFGSGSDGDFSRLIRNRLSRTKPPFTTKPIQQDDLDLFEIFFTE